MTVPRSSDIGNPTHLSGPGRLRARNLLAATAAPSALVALGLMATIVALSPANASAQTIDEKLWVTNGPVNAVIRDGETIYIGGCFTQVRSTRSPTPIGSGGVPIDSASGAFLPTSAKVAGSVFAVVSDGAGGWYVGGSFTMVGGLPRSNLAHLASDLSVSSWSPNADGIVRALAVNGSAVYAGGDFTSIGGQARNHIAAVDATTGAATEWNPDANGGVAAFTPIGSTVYVCGAFTNVGGQARNSIAALDAITGAATAWDPSPSGGGVGALAVRDSVIYVGGSFTSIGGQARSCIAALDATTGEATEWNPSARCTRPHAPCPPSVTRLTVNDSTVYVGGTFTSIGGQARNSLAALDAATGTATPWVPSTPLVVASGSIACGTEPTTCPGPCDNEVVGALVVTGSTVYVGGGSGGDGYISTFDAMTGAATGWKGALFDSTVWAIAAFRSTVYAGGDFTASVPAAHARSGIAALDARTGEVTPWTPDGGGEVYALAVNGSIVYVGGNFTLIGGQERSCIAALDGATGVATAWDPNATPGAYPPQVGTIAVSGSTVYVGGVFGGIGGQTRNNIAALDATTGAATAWDPNPNDFVSSLELSGSTVYVGGPFTGIGGQARNHIAGLDATTASATDWNPNSDGDVGVLAVNGSTIYVGGGFTNIGGQARNHIAALDAGTGAAAVWNPDANGYVGALALDGSTVYAGGDFTTIGGLPQAHIAGMGDVTMPTLLSLVSAQAEPGRVRLTWFAGDGHVFSATVYRRTATEGWGILGQVSADGTGRLIYEDTRVIAGERYGYRLGVVQGAAEEFLGETWVDVPRALEFALSGLRPNPASRGLTAAFSLPDAAPARLELLDLAGRKVLVRDVGALGGGSHVVPLAEERTIAPGLYVLRLSRRGRSLTARAIVVR